MQVTLKYTSGYRFGTKWRSLNYKTSLSSKKDSIKDEVEIAFHFEPRTGGRQAVPEAEAKVKELTLTMSREEAMKLATSILANGHHPTMHHFPIEWMPVESMPVLHESQWINKLNLSGSGFDHEVVVKNSTHFHIGSIRFKVTCQVLGDVQRWDVELTKFVDVPPGHTRAVPITTSDVQQACAFVIRDVVPLVVTGFIPSDPLYR